MCQATHRMLFRRAGRVLVAGGAASLLAASLVAGPTRIDGVHAGTHEVTAPADASGFRRLNETQYARTVEAVFGPGIRVPGRFDPPLRAEGLLAIGDGTVTVTPSSMEQYELRAGEIAAQVLAPDRRAKTVPCASAAATFDRACASAFLGKYGRRLYRRPLSDRELASTVALAEKATVRSGHFDKGLEIALSRLLMSPNFIFRVEGAEPDGSGGRRLDRYALATRISFLLWDAPPDDRLLDAAARGDLFDDAKLGTEVDRMMADARFETGMRAFFSDMLGYEQFAGLNKDQSIYPKFNAQMAADAKEQLLRTIVARLVTDKGDYRDLFTTRRTVMNRNMAALYRVPVAAAGMNGWVPYEFGPKEPRAGILSLAGFLMLDPTHEGRSSPTIRGKSVREFLLCQEVPQPPPNVDFALVQDTKNPQFRTARQRLAIHQENPACAGCHKLTDPIGLTMEQYDAFGNFRTTENGAKIDATGSFEGKDFDGLVELSKVLGESPDVPACLVQRSFEYGVGRAAAGGEQSWLEKTGEAFGRDGYRIAALFRSVATGRPFAAAPGMPAATTLASR